MGVFNSIVSIGMINYDSGRDKIISSIKIGGRIKLA
jgi:hypothetical protein